MLELLIAGIILISLILYALLGGADFGGGMWDLLASGPRAQRQRKAIADAIVPIWEANHVWLILVIVLLFTAFPQAFSAIMIALHIPIVAMLIGIVFRGSAFIFRKYDVQHDVIQRRWSTIFGVASFFTPFLQGMTVGALASGAIRVKDGFVSTGFFAGWLTPFAFACGFFALALFAFLAATYIPLDVRGDRDLQDDFRRRAIIAEFALVPIAAWVFFTSRDGAPQMYEGLTNWWAPLLLGWTGLCVMGALAALWMRKYALARIAAIGQVTLILFGWGMAQYPYFVVPDITISSSAAPIQVFRLLVLALGAGVLLLFPSLYYLFYVFKRDTSR